MVMLLSMLMLNVLLFSAGWLLGVARPSDSEPRVVARETPSRSEALLQRLALRTPRPATTPARTTIAASAPFVMPRWSPPEEVAPLGPQPMLIASRETGPRRYAPRDYASLIEEAAYRESVPSSLVAAIARVESNFDARAISPKGALGIMQVMPDTARRFGFDAARLHDPVHNVAAGATYLRWLIERYDGDLDRVIAAYNAGEGAVDKYDGVPPYRETQDFVKRVRAVLEKSGVKAATTVA